MNTCAILRTIQITKTDQMNVWKGIFFVSVKYFITFKIATIYVQVYICIHIMSVYV